MPEKKEIGRRRQKRRSSEILVLNNTEEESNEDHTQPTSSAEEEEGTVVLLDRNLCFRLTFSDRRGLDFTTAPAAADGGAKADFCKKIKNS